MSNSFGAINTIAIWPYLCYNVSLESRRLYPKAHKKEAYLS